MQKELICLLVLTPLFFIGCSHLETSGASAQESEHHVVYLLLPGEAERFDFIDGENLLEFLVRTQRIEEGDLARTLRIVRYDVRIGESEEYQVVPSQFSSFSMRRNDRVWIPYDYRLVVIDLFEPKPDGQPLHIHTNTASATLTVNSVDELLGFVENLDNGARLYWNPGCVVINIVQDSGARDLAFFIPVGEETISLEDFRSFCDENGIRFGFSYGY